MKKRRTLSILFLSCIFAMTFGACSTAHTLTEKEVEQFNTEVFNEQENRLPNMFLLVEYDSVQEIDFSHVFYNGVTLNAPALTALEETFLQQQGIDLAYDVIKITSEDMDKALKAYTGLSLAEIPKSSLASFYYNEELNAYYLVHSDTEYVFCQVEEGYEDDKGNVILTYRKNEFPFTHLTEDEVEKLPKYEVTLQKEGKHYLFVSNRILK